jgi:hypothetical protein
MAVTAGPIVAFTEDDAGVTSTRVETLASMRFIHAHVAGPGASS